MALANYRKTIRALISSFGESYHAHQTQILAAEFERRDVRIEGWTPSALAAVMQNIARCFALGAVFDIQAHADAKRQMTEALGRLIHTGDARPLTMMSGSPPHAPKMRRTRSQAA